MSHSLTHFDEDGNCRMVNVGDKAVTRRIAVARARVNMAPETALTIQTSKIAKGDVLSVARLAGIMAAKQVDRLIPLCHQVVLDAVEVNFSFANDSVLEIESSVRCEAKTGVEMEALMAVSVAALTVYDMCKSIDRGMSIESIRLEKKSGGRSGDFERATKDDHFERGNTDQPSA